MNSGRRIVGMKELRREGWSDLGKADWKEKVKKGMWVKRLLRKSGSEE